VKEYLVRCTTAGQEVTYVNDVMRSSVYTTNIIDDGMKFQTLEIAKAFRDYCAPLYSLKKYEVIARETVITVEGE